MDAALRAVAEILATTPHVMFCVKSADGEYVAANRTFAERAGVGAAGAVIGKTAHDLFPAELADSYVRQDAEVVATGRPLTNELEFITRPDGSIGWYLTSKSVVVDERGEATIVSISVDLRTPADASAPHAALSDAVQFAREHVSRTVTVSDMADAAGMSTAQLERSMRRILGLSPKQLMLRLRLENAIHELDTSDDPIAEVALRCGYYDQSAFTRHFTRVVGMSPGAFRKR